MKGIRDWTPGTYPLSPLHSGRTSFHGKATVEVGPKGDLQLRSYGTPVAWIDTRGRFHRLWNGWSSTTNGHIHEFLLQYAEGGPPENVGVSIRKADWLGMEVEEVPAYVGLTKGRT